MKINFWSILIFCFLITSKGYSQQIEQYSMFMFNKLMINPATAGLKKDVRVKATYRKQWLGAFNGEEPTSYLLSLSARSVNAPNIGVGLNLFNDVTGPTRRTGFDLNYAYRIELPKTKSTLALGIAATLLQYSLDVNSLNPLDMDDTAIYGEQNSKTGGDVDFGAYLYNNNYYIGVSIAQLFNSQLTFSSDTLGYIRLDRHYYIMAGYEYEFGKDLKLEPFVLIKAIESAPVQYEVGTIIKYKKDYWLGLNYRTEDALAVFAGLKIKDNWNLNYAYDITTSRLNTLSTGAHEILVGYRFKFDKF